MQVDHAAQALLYYPQQRFAFVESPFYIATDFPWQSSSLNWNETSDGLVTDYELQAVYPAPLFVPHHQCKSPIDGTLTAFWKYRYVPPPTPGWAAYMQLHNTGGMTSSAYGKYALPLIGPGIAWKQGPSNKATFDFRMNDQYSFVELRVIPFNFVPGNTYYSQPVSNGSTTNPYYWVDNLFDQNYKSGSTKSFVNSTGLPDKYAGGRTLDIYTDDIDCMGATFMWLMTSPKFGTESTLSQAFSVTDVNFASDGPITVTVNAAHGLVDGDFVTITNVLSTPPGVGASEEPSYANGEWQVANCTSTTFTIVGLTGNGSTYSGGTGFVFPMLGAIEFFIGVGSGSGLQQYRVLVIEGHDPILYRENDSGGWTKLRSLPWGGGQSQNKVQQDQNLQIATTVPYLFPSTFSANQTESEWLPAQKQFEVRLLGGRLQFRMNAGDEAYYVDDLRIGDDGVVIDRLNFARIRATYVSSMVCSMHPMKFRANARYSSPEIPIGFASDNFSGVAIDYAGNGQVPGAWNVLLDEAESELRGPTVQYGLNLKSPTIEDRYKGIEYVNDAPVIRAVHLAWDPVIYPTFPQATVVSPERIVTRSIFNLDDLTVAWDGEKWFNANGDKLLPDGTLGAWGQWSQRNGQRAAEVNLARTLASGGMSQYYRVFTGYAHTNGSVLMNPTSEIAGAGSMAGTHFRMGMADRRIQLLSDEFALPWMDGWNYFYAIAYLAQLAGVSLDDMAFAGLVPEVPFGPGSDLGTQDGQPAPYLPVGDGGTVQTRYTGLAPWAIMQKLAYAIGFMLYFDAFGRLDTRKFRIPTGIKRSFYESDVASTAQAGGGMEGCRNVQTDKDHSVVRNQTVIAGINAFAPLYDPIVVKYSDDDSIRNPLAFNHLGYRQRFAWVDSQFADPYFADQAAQKMHAYLRTPAITVNFETNWLQPDIFPIDVIMFQSSKTGTSWLPMLVTSVIHDVTIDTARSIISARYIPL